MLRKVVSGLGLLAVCCPALARPPAALAPSGPWLPLKSADSCKLSRAFGEGKDRVVAVFERVAPGSRLNLLVFGPGLRSGPAARGGQVRFLPAAGPSFTGGLSAMTARGETVIQWSAVDFAPDLKVEPGLRTAGQLLALKAANLAAKSTAAAQVTGVEVSEPGGNRIVLQTGTMTAVQDSLEACARDQLQSWGLDPAVRHRIVLGPRSDRKPGDFVDERDYPVLALRHGGEAIITARLIVDADGKVSRCTTITDFAEPEMKELVCRGLSKATFQPAVLDDGTKVPDFTMLRFRFGMAP
ncbi:hypothetical protein [Sphingomonas humi]|uniref:TonB C-terminal domain-containing protein n=1 Tax=Sphingomonas humi TaxID=335630 RepID=A0ABP7RID7_9SPHN